MQTCRPMKIISVFTAPVVSAAPNKHMIAPPRIDQRREKRSQQYPLIRAPTHPPSPSTLSGRTDFSQLQFVWQGAARNPRDCPTLVASIRIDPGEPRIIGERWHGKTLSVCRRTNVSILLLVLE